MHKVFKHITWMLTVAFTLITCSGCLDNTVGEVYEPPITVSLTTSPANITYRAMNEELFIGYLGAQRDFALVVDNLQYNYDHDKGGCANNEDVGCASAMGQLLIQHGIKAAKVTNNPSDKNVLIYYISADEFMDIGSGSDWLSFLSPGSADSELSDFNSSDTVVRYSCGTGSKEKICEYAKEMRDAGYSTSAGNAMMLFFHAGELAKIVTDKGLDPLGKLDTAIDHDNIIKSGDDTLYTDYYDKLNRAVKTSAIVSDTTADSTVTATKRSITQLETISELINLVEGKGAYAGINDYLLLITTEGFISPKIGNNYSYTSISDAKNGTNLTAQYEGLGGSISQAVNNILLLLNTATTYDDNCAVENDEFINFLKAALETLLSIGAGAAIGAAIGSMIFPGIGTAVGAVIGGILGFFANLVIGDVLADANGITGDKYCKIMLAALNDFEINVPVYSYKVGSFIDHKPMAGGTVEGNLTKYVNGTLDEKLTEYYQANERTCLTQDAKIGVASGMASLLIGNLAQEYNYADKCEINLVRSIVGGFKGSPSLLLFVNGKQVDDLHGRATTALIREIVFSWGLTQIGNIYTLASNKTMNSMEVTFGGAQEIYGLRYCTSTSSIPTCEGQTSTYVSHSNYSVGGPYIGALKPENGVKVDFMEAYKSVSKSIISGSSYRLYLNNLDAYNKKPSGGAWELALMDPEYIGSNLSIINLQAEINNKFVEKADSIYAIKYGAMIYLIGDSFIVGYDPQKVASGTDIIVEYYWDGSNEYILENELLSQADADSKYLTRNLIDSGAEINVSGAHDDLYIYMEYSTADGSTNVYTYKL